MIKKIIYVAMGLFALYITLCLVGPKKIHVERSIVVNALPEIIKPKLADFKFFQEQWSPWAEKDPNMKTNFEGETGRPGSKYSWQGNKEVGSGSMELIAINGDSILQKIVFTAPHSSGGDVYLLTTPNGNATTVSWGVRFDVNFMTRGFMLFMNMNKLIGDDYDKGLEKLKIVIEAMPVTKSYNGYEIKEVAWPQTIYYGKKETVPFDKLNGFMMEIFPKIFNDAVISNLQHTGAPSGLFYSYDEQKKQTECAAVISVPNGQKLKGWEKLSVPASAALLLIYHGDYAKIKEAYAALDQYLQENGLTHGLGIEEYIVGPLTDEKDTAKWVTNIYYIINNTNNIEVRI